MDEQIRDLLWPLDIPPVEFVALESARPWREPLRVAPEPEPLRWEVRTLTAPNGEQVVARVPVYGPGTRRKRLKRKWRGQRLY